MISLPILPPSSSPYVGILSLSSPLPPRYVLLQKTLAAVMASRPDDFASFTGSRRALSRTLFGPADGPGEGVCVGGGT